jgi:hypothetical protein
MLNVPGVRMADGLWAALLALPIVLATAVGTSLSAVLLLVCCGSRPYSRPPRVTARRVRRGPVPGGAQCR